MKNIVIYLKIYSTIAINFISSKDTDEKRLMRLKSDKS